MTPALRRRRERAERQKGLVREQQELLQQSGHNESLYSNGYDSVESHGGGGRSSSPTLIPLGRSPSSKRDVHTLVNNSPETKNNGRSWMLPIYPKSNDEAVPVSANSTNSKENLSLTSDISLKRENTVKDLTQKLSSSNITSPVSAPEDSTKTFSCDFTGIISKAKEGLAKSKSKADIKAQNGLADSSGLQAVANPVNSSAIEQKKSDNELHWDFLVSNLQRPLAICDLDFTELKPDDDVDIISPHQLCSISMGSNGSYTNGGISPTGTLNSYPPAPPPQLCNGGPPPPPPVANFGKMPPPPSMSGMGKLTPPAAPPLFGVPLKHQPSPNSIQAAVSKSNSNKTKKTVKLFWKEVREDPMTAMKVEDIGSIWDELTPIPLDTAKLEHLFESRAKDLINKVK